MQHLNTEVLKKSLFKWLLDTFERLSNEEMALRQKRARKEAERSGMAFKQMTEAQKIKAGLESSESEDDVKPKQSENDE